MGGSAAAAMLLLAMTVSATGFRIPDQDPRATARGEAFAATAEHAAAIHYNPAGLAQLQGHYLRAGVYGLNLNTSYESSVGSFDNAQDLHAIHQLFYACGPDKLPLAFGLGLYSPYGLSSRWPEDSGFRTVATEGRLTYWTVHPVVAWRVVPALSLAGGLTVNYVDADLQQGLTPIPHNDLFRFQGDGTALGYNLGLLWKPHEKVSVGVSYRSTTTVDLKGHRDNRTCARVAAVPGVLFGAAKGRGSLPVSPARGLWRLLSAHA
jgi:long-chain fatty acid transport protein